MFKYFYHCWLKRKGYSLEVYMNLQIWFAHDLRCEYDNYEKAIDIYNFYEGMGIPFKHKHFFIGNITHFPKTLIFRNYGKNREWDMR